MSYLVAGLLLFLGVHSISIVAPAWRDATAARLGVGWRGIYSLLSIAGFILIVVGYGIARTASMTFYVPPLWLRHLTALLMLPVFPLLLAAYLPGRIRTTMKHPMLAAVKFWALAHLLANGNLADVLLFGGFLIWAVADRISMKKRTQRAIPGAPPSKANDWIAILVGLAIYFAFVKWLHLRWIGVSPLPL